MAFLTEAADDYEQALREIDRLRSDLMRMEALLTEHREREANLRNTLLTAQKLSDDIKDAAQHEARITIREAEGRADLVIQKAQSRLEEIERGINELRLRRRSVEGSLEASIQALYHALEFIRDQDKDEQEKVLLHRPRQAEPQQPQTPPAATFEEWKAGGGNSRPSAFVAASSMSASFHGRSRRARRRAGCERSCGLRGAAWTES